MEREERSSRLENEISELRDQLEKQSKLKQNYQKALEQLQEKEAFNFALFQFNPFDTVVVNRQGKVVKSNAAKLKSGDRLPNIGDTMYRDYASRHNRDMYAELISCIESGKPKTFPELKYDDRTLAVTIAPFDKGAIIVSRDITPEKRAEQEKITLINDLQKALDEIKTLRELLPICSGCKKIRDDKGYWNEIEEYFQKRGNLDFSHTMCPDCISKIYPDIWQRMEKENAGKG